MANRFFSPNQQFADNTGLPYAGGSLTFYASGTSTPLATYSDRALSIANTNPVVLDSAGRAGNVFLQNLAYKVILSDVNNNPIWTEDPVYSSDFSTVAQFQSGNGSPNGSVAGSAGSATIPASSYWDATNNILYICTQTGTASTAVWTAINSSTAAAVVPSPQGYLTPVSGTPVITSDSVSATQVYYTPYAGNIVPIYSGSSFVPTVFAEVALALVAQHVASTIYDVFAFNNSGIVTIATGPAWSTSTAGAGARGSGAGTTQLSRLSGLLVNTVSMSARNGSTTYTIPASQGTYLGSISIDANPGQVSSYRSVHQNGKWGIWNAYNRQAICLMATDPNTWAYTSNTWRNANNTNNNNVQIFSGLAEETFDLQTTGFVGSTLTTNQSTGGSVGIGYNSSSSPSGKIGTYNFTNSNASSIVINNSITAHYLAPPTIGINTVNALENGQGVVVATWNGTQSFMLLSAQYRG